MLSAAAAFIWAVEHQVHIAFVLKSGTLVLRLLEGVVPDELLLVVADSLTDTDDLTEIAADIMPEKPVLPSANERVPRNDSAISRGAMRPETRRSRKKEPAEKPASSV